MTESKRKQKRHHPGFEPKPAHVHESLHFPSGFLWGSATSAHQVEGWNDNSDWWEWEHKAGTIADGQLSGRATDHYHRYQQDFALAQELGQNIHRLSIEWSRIERAPGVYDRKQVQHYVNVLASAKARGMQTMVTLHHFTNPLWFAKRGGFVRKENIRFFINYLRHIVPIFAPHISYWVTFNEPNIYVLMSYVLGLWPPGKASKWQAYRVFRHLALAHKQAYDLIHHTVRGQTAQVGIANNVISFGVVNKHSTVDLVAARAVDWAWNHWFLEKTKGYHDYLGVNYYVHRRVHGSSFKDLRRLVEDNDLERRERTDLDWEVYPPGLFEALIDMSSYKLPIFITENGISTLNDDRRSRYIVSYIKEMFHAIQSGVDVRGYLYWSLLDNFEWDKGLKARFGLMEVDFTTLERTIRPSAYVYGRIARENAINHDLFRFIGHSARPEKAPKALEQSGAQAGEEATH